MIALVGGIGRFVVLHAGAAVSPDPRYHDLLYRFDAIITNYPIVFAIILYGVLIPNTPRRSLIGAGLLCLVPVTATAAGPPRRIPPSGRRSPKSSPAA